MQVVTVVVEDGKVIEDYITGGKELDRVIEKNEALIEEYRDGMQTTGKLYSK